MSKQYYLTPKDFEDIGCKVITNKGPVTVLNNMPLTAKIFRYKDLNELKESDMIMDCKAMNSYIFMCESDIEKIKEYERLNLMGNISKDFVDDINDADELFVRLYVKV